MKEQKAFVNNNGVAIFTCPKCQTAKHVDAKKYRQLDKVIRVNVRCSCGHSYKAMLERRQFFRKSVELKGIYFLSDGNRGTLTIKDISRTGINFETNTDVELAVGDKFMVEFYLDDTHKTMIKKEIVIRSIKGSSIGAEFFTIDPNNVYDKALGFYLM